MLENFKWHFKITVRYFFYRKMMRYLNNFQNKILSLHELRKISLHKLLRKKANNNNDGTILKSERTNVLSSVGRRAMATLLLPGAGDGSRRSGSKFLRNCSAYNECKVFFEARRKQPLNDSARELASKRRFVIRRGDTRGNKFPSARKFRGSRAWKARQATHVGTRAHAIPSEVH